MKTTLRIGWILLCLVLALAARSWNLRDVFIEGRIYFVDADCYSRMTRAALVAEHPGTILRHHDFENWPQGIAPHTTAPLDYLIVGVKSVLDLGFAVLDAGRTSVLHDQSLDLAGAIISPLLGVGGALFLGLWLWRFRVRYGGMALLLYAASPILVHGTLLGRPDHQSLLIFLLTIAAGGELALAEPTIGTEAERRGWGVVAGVAWALSLWVSWYEPPILLLAVVALWVLARLKSAPWPPRRMGVVVGLAIVVISIGLEGWRAAVPGGADWATFTHWGQTIGELEHLDLRSPLLFKWLGWTVVGAPVLLFLAGKIDRRAWSLLALLVVTFGLTLWQLRWGYFLALAFVWALPWFMQVVRRPWLAWLIFVASLWPVLKDWDACLYPSDLAQDRLEMQRAEVSTLRDLVMETAGKNAGPVLAPWWLSPAIAYWTRNPCVAGSSHQSLPGIIDTARFFLSNSPDVESAILRTRRVRWVVADDPLRVVANSATLLAATPPLDPLATALMDHPDEVPDFLQEWKGSVAKRTDGVRFYRLYQVDDAKLAP